MKKTSYLLKSIKNRSNFFKTSVPGTSWLRIQNSRHGKTKSNEFFYLIEVVAKLRNCSNFLPLTRRTCGTFGGLSANKHEADELVDLVVNVLMSISSFLLCFESFPTQLHKNCKVTQLHAINRNSFIVVRSRTKRNVKKLNNSILTHIYFTKEWRCEHFSALICLFFQKSFAMIFPHKNYSKSFFFFQNFLFFFFFQNTQKFVSPEKCFFCLSQSSRSWNICDGKKKLLKLFTALGKLFCKQKLKVALCCAETFHFNVVSLFMLRAICFRLAHFNSTNCAFQTQGDKQKSRNSIWQICAATSINLIQEKLFQMLI